MKKIIVLALAIGCVIVNLNAQSADEKAVTTAVESLRKAMVDADKATLDKITEAKLTYGHSSGKIEDKAAFIDAIVSGKSDFTKIDLSEQTIAITGNTAIVRHVLKGETNNDGTPGTVNLGVMLVFIKAGKEWKLVGRQAVKLQ